MGLKNKFYLIFTLTLLIISCKKENSSTVTEINYPNFSAVKPGNYWIYQHYKIDNSGNSTPMDIFDSCYVEKDTMINSKKYYKLNRPNHGNLFPINNLIRDSLHYIINSKGEILFSSQDFQTIFISYYDILNSTDTITHTVFKMEDKNATTITQAGTFTTSNAEKTIYLYSNNIVSNVKTGNTLYSEKTGIITESANIFQFAMYNYERRLVRYHVN
jgi:hypothetical protein